MKELLLNKNILTIPLLIILLTSSCTTLKVEQTAGTSQSLPSTAREFRGAWVATVANITWPSRKDLTTEEQKQEAINILDKLKQNNFNAVIFQARPQCDAFYKSNIEPWSYYLTGTQGKAPEPFYDPLEFWIEQTHARGMELHVWLNPFRAHHISGGEISEASVVKNHPGWVVKLKSGYWWLDPGKKEVRDYTLSVVLDITKRYDIDGIHFDDYFYPYPSYNNDEDFPDEASWKKYTDEGGTLSKADWRRDNINKFILRVYKGIKDIKQNVKFGLSPFGIWRPGNPESVEGFDQYEKLFADSKLWINEGWVDYWSPQLYWKINSLKQSFPILLSWWKNENSRGRHFWPGISIDRENNETNNIEVINQIMTIRAMLPDSPGNICWNANQIINNKELSAALLNGPYKEQALVPVTKWFMSRSFPSPVFTTQYEQDSVRISWTHKDSSKVFLWVVYFKYGSKWEYEILSGNQKSYTVPLTKEHTLINESGVDITQSWELKETAVTAVDRISNESIPVLKQLERK